MYKIQNELLHSLTKERKPWPIPLSLTQEQKPADPRSFLPAADSCCDEEFNPAALLLASRFFCKEGSNSNFPSEKIVDSSTVSSCENIP